MPPRQRPTCLVCHHQASKYTCASCRANYCSVACYKQHKETCSSDSTGTANASIASIETSVPPVQRTADSLPAHVHTLRFYPSAPQNADPNPSSELNASDNGQPTDVQDPTPLRPLTALKWPYVPDTSAYPDPLTRDDPKPLQLHQYEAIATSPTVRTILKSNPRLCDLLTSIDALRGAEREEALQRALGVNSRLLRNDDAGMALVEDTRAFRKLAEAVEVAVRGDREDVLGLDWD